MAHLKMKDRADVFASRKHFQSDTQRRLYGTQGPASAVRRVEVSAIDATALVAQMEEHICARRSETWKGIVRRATIIDWGARPAVSKRR
jgi:hypothetical protein